MDNLDPTEFTLADIDEGLNADTWVEYDQTPRGVNTRSVRFTLAHLLFLVERGCVEAGGEPGTYYVTGAGWWVSETWRNESWGWAVV